MIAIRSKRLALCVPLLLLTCKTLKTDQPTGESDPFSVATLNTMVALERSEAKILSLGAQGDSPELLAEMAQFDAIILQIKREGQNSVRDYLDKNSDAQSRDPNMQSLRNLAQLYSSDATAESGQASLAEGNPDNSPKLCKAVATANSQGGFHQIFLTSYYWGYNAGVAKNGGGRWLGW